jgi:uncharacterized protein
VVKVWDCINKFDCIRQQYKLLLLFFQEAIMHRLDRQELNAGWELPATYGVDRVVLLPRDPYWLFAYWEITPALSENNYQKYGSAWHEGRGILRVFDNDGGGFQDTEVDLSETGSWHFNVGSAGHAYHVELGKLLPGGRFIAILTSNTVRTPSDSLSSVLDPRWKMFAFWHNRYFRRMVVGLSSYELFDHTEQPVSKGVYRD